ncbi:MAG: HAD hydrolase-like protein [Bacteroidia bacterium]
MVGDNIESDIEGALNAGWKAIWLSPPLKQEKIIQIEDLTQVKSFL